MSEIYQTKHALSRLARRTILYTGCPAAYPVVWCALPGVGHNSSSSNE